jgi:polar amino acid transport system permease protein
MNLGILKLILKAIILAVLAAIAIGLLYWLFFASNWSWFPRYLPLMIRGLWLTLQLFVISVIFGFILAVPIGLVQVTGPPWLAFIARWFCTLIRGTPLLIQLWLLYYGFGSLFPSIPGIRESFLWPVLREGYYYAALAFTLSFAGYEGEVMRGAFLGVPRGELEAARAYGMSPYKVLMRVWLPRAVRLVLPTLTGETVLQLQSMPIAFTVTVMELVGVASKVRQDTYIIYEPLMFMGFVYICLTFIFVYVFGLVEKMVPQKR